MLVGTVRVGTGGWNSEGGGNNEVEGVGWNSGGGGNCEGVGIVRVGTIKQFKFSQNYYIY